jgi:peptidoglycan hydrolase-like protein with peptidoglycan-binding domain
MLKRRIRTLAVTGITIGAAALVTLSTTAASAATATASTPGRVTALKPAAATACVYQDFGIWDQNTYEQCVADEQILLNNLYNKGVLGPDQRLTVDGYYGNDTLADVEWFQYNDQIADDGITGPVTWSVLCEQDWFFGFTGVYWHAVGCPAVY